ncbi:hypothetical protein [Thiocystis violacea]|uniref:hypothetical protein n=1 Tax=Thiocystis violacea TaxID=13725 RepID=UPI001906DDDA|nr:hypothetical protein [Thiocystis violacea]
MAVEFIPIDRDTPLLLPPRIQAYLPERHLARFVVEIVEQLDVSALVDAYRGTGSQPYPPAMLVTLLFYGYATGLYSCSDLQTSDSSMAWYFS